MSPELIPELIPEFSTSLNSTNHQATPRRDLQPRGCGTAACAPRSAAEAAAWRWLMVEVKDGWLTIGVSEGVRMLVDELGEWCCLGW